jgi:hypothetical protein
MKAQLACLLALAALAPGQLEAQQPDQKRPAPPAPDVPPQQAPDKPRLGVELAAIGPDCHLTFAELDDLLLARHGNSPLGQDTLGALAQLVVVEELAKSEGISASRADLNQRWRTLEEQIISSGTADSLADYLEQQGIKRKTFQRHLRLSVLHERLARKSLGLGPDDPLSGEQQTHWLNGIVDSLEQKKGEYPWSDGTVLTIGPHVSAEIARRRKAVEANSTFQGVAYEQLLKAQGLSLATVRRDPAIRAAAMAHLFVDRTHGDAELRAVYEEERNLFDSLHGEGHAISVLVLSAARFANELSPRTFEAAESELEAMKEQIASPKDFERLVGLHSDEPASQERKGYLGIITRGSRLVPETVRAALWAHIDKGVDSPEGSLLGPLRLQGGVLLLQIGAYRPLPTWEQMRDHVHQELRRRLVSDALPRAAVSTWLDL